MRLFVGLVVIIAVLSTVIVGVTNAVMSSLQAEPDSSLVPPTVTLDPKSSGVSTSNTAPGLPPSASMGAPSGSEGSSSKPTVGAASSASAANSKPGTALALLDTLPVKGRAAKTGYDRVVKFGASWKDVDDNGCDTRNDILARDLTNIETSGRCKVMSGTLRSAYSGEMVHFVRGVDTSAEVQIDHVVPLSNAWQTGAQQITQAQREALANDPLNLQAVEGALNGQKSDSDAATWLPPLKSYRCAYVARQVSVKAAYGLWVTRAEHNAMAKVLELCPGQIGYASSLY